MCFGYVSKVLLHNACAFIGLIDCRGIFISVTEKIAADNRMYRDDGHVNFCRLFLPFSKIKIVS